MGNEAELLEATGNSATLCGYLGEKWIQEMGLEGTQGESGGFRAAPVGASHPATWGWNCSLCHPPPPFCAWEQMRSSGRKKNSLPIEISGLFSPMRGVYCLLWWLLLFPSYRNMSGSQQNYLNQYFMFMS